MCRHYRHVPLCLALDPDLERKGNYKRPSRGNWEDVVPGYYIIIGHSANFLRYNESYCHFREIEAESVGAKKLNICNVQSTDSKR